MRINIAIDAVNEVYLENEADKFANREAVKPYLVMSEITLKKLIAIAKNNITVCDDGFEFHNYKILINNDLKFGDVDIR